MVPIHLKKKVGDKPKKEGLKKTRRKRRRRRRERRRRTNLQKQKRKRNPKKKLRKRYHPSDFFFLAVFFFLASLFFARFFSAVALSFSNKKSQGKSENGSALPGIPTALEFATFDFSSGKPVPLYLKTGKRKPSKYALLKQAQDQKEKLEAVKGTEEGQVKGVFFSMFFFLRF